MRNMNRLLGVVVLVTVLSGTFALPGIAAAQTPPPQADLGTGYYGGTNGMMLVPVSALLGMTPQELVAELATGKSVFQVATARGVSEQAVLDAAIAPYRDMLALNVKYGYLSQQQADQLLVQERARLLDAFGTAGAPSGSYGWGGYGDWGCGMMGGYYGTPSNRANSNSGSYDHGSEMMGRNHDGAAAGNGRMGGGRGWR